MKLILMNGAWAHDLAANEDLFVLNLNKNTAGKAVESLKSHDYEVIVQKSIPDSHIFYYDSLDESNIERTGRIRRNFDRCIFVEDIYGVLNEDPGEITVLDSDDRIRQCREILQAQNLNCRLIYSTSPFVQGYSWLEIVHPDAEKGNALRYLADKMGLSRDEVLAVGDNYNDIEMIRWAGIGAAVENAEQEVKNTADIVLNGKANSIAELKIYF